MTSGAGETWWDDFYDERFGALVLDRMHAEVPATVDRLGTWLRLDGGARVFDQCCGNGRLALPLARRGLSVVGVDAARGYVEEATRLARAESLDARFFVDDARCFVAPERCRAAINWGMSFGHAATDADNVAMLRSAATSLVSGGRFALEYTHVPALLREFQPTLSRVVSTAEGEVTIVRESTLDLVRGVHGQVWTWVLPSGERVKKWGATRLYMPHELARLLELAGFVDVELIDREGLPLSHTSTRCVVLAVRGSCGASQGSTPSLPTRAG